MQLHEIKARVDLHDLADRLGLVRPQSNGNYHSPHKKDKSPSLSIFTAKSGEPKWKDFGTDLGGDCFDLVQYVDNCDPATAIQRVRDMYGFPAEQKQQQPRTQLSTIEYIAQQCLKTPEKAIEYLEKERGIDAETIKAAIDRKSLGFSEWTSTSRAPSTLGHGGPAIATICRSVITGEVLGVDYRYLDPSLNGGLKTKSQGDKSNAPWTSCRHTLARAHTVVVVESAINALTVETIARQTGRLQGWAAIATRGASNNDIDWSFLRGKRVVICHDNDKPIEKGPKAGFRPGLTAAWGIVDALTALNIPAMLVDHADWEDINDINDFLRARGPVATRSALENVEPWLIPGLPGGDFPGKKRLFLPAHDFELYWKYRVKADFTSLVKEVDGGDGKKYKQHEDVCGFRVAALSRITIASAQATMTGEQDAQPHVAFAASVQIPRHGNTLLRRVFKDEALHNLTNWNKLGPVFRPQQFSRMLAIWERATDLGARNAANFVGLCYREGRLAVNEGQDSYFTEPEKQCPYHNLKFPSGPVSDAATVITAYQATFTHNAAALLLTWALGSHLKAMLGFWPHMVLQADKGSGKSVLTEKLSLTLGITMFSGQTLGSEFRLMTSVSHTCHPVVWEELSARGSVIIDKAVALLQETYRFTVTRRGADMTEFLLSAPVLLAGEDVPVDSLLGKVVRTQLSGRKGELLPQNLPKFPVREWLQWLAQLDPQRVRNLHAATKRRMLERSAASHSDSGADRIIENFSALGTAWLLLAEFAGLPPEIGGLPDDLTTEMNRHVIDTKAAREPWVWILEIILGEIDRRMYPSPVKFEAAEGDTWLILRTTHCMQHLSQNNALRAKYDSLPVKSAKVFLQQLDRAGVIAATGIERSIKGHRVAHMQALSLNKLHEYGLTVSVPDSDQDHYNH